MSKELKKEERKKIAGGKSVSGNKPSIAIIDTIISKNMHSKEEANTLNRKYSAFGNIVPIKKDESEIR